MDLFRIAREVEEQLKDCEKDIKIAVMGCAVNGPGEARDAEIGLAGGKGEMLLFRKGEPLRKVPEAEAVAALVSLGYSQTEAAAAIAKLDPALPVDELIKGALKRLSRGV